MSTHQARFSNETEMAIQKSEESRIAYKFNMEKCENLVEEANILFGELDDIKAQCWEIVENMSSKEPLFMPIEHQQRRQMNLEPKEVENKYLIDDATIDSSGEWIEEASIGIQTSFATFVEDCTVESTPNNSTHIAIDKISTPDRQAPKDLQENATSESANNTKLIETASEKETLSTPLDQKENSVLEDFQKCSPSENSTPNKTVTIALKNTQNLEQESYEKSKQSFAIQTSFTDDSSLNSTKTSQANNTYSVFTPKPMMKSFTAQTSFIDKSLLEPENKTEIVDDEQPSTNEATLANREDLANTSNNNSSQNNENNSSQNNENNSGENNENNSGENNENNSSKNNENNSSKNNENNSIEQEQHNNTVVITTINNIENNVDGISIENNFNENSTTKDNVDKNSNANNIDESKVASTNITVASLTGNIADLNFTNNADNKVDFANSTVADKSLDNKTNAEDKSRTLNITCLTEQDSMYLENFMNHNDSGFTLDQAKKAQTSYLQQKEEKKHMNPNQTGLYYSFIKQKGRRPSRITRSASKLLNASQLNKSSTLEKSQILNATYLTVDDSMYLENFMNPNDTVFTYERAKEAQQAYFEKGESLYFNPNQTGVQYSFNSKKRLKDNEKKNSNSVEIDGQKNSTEDEEHRKEQFEEFEESIEFMNPNCSPSSRNHLQRTANTTKLQEVNSSATPVHFDIKNKSCVSEKSIYEVAAPIDNATINISELKTADSNDDDHMHADLSKKHSKMNEISRTSNKQKSENDVKNSIILHPGDSVAVKRKRRSSPAEPDVSQNIPSEAEIEVAEMHEHDQPNATIKPEHSIMRITRSRNQQSINETQTALNSSKQSRRSNQLLKETDICPQNENHANTLIATPSEICMEIPTAVQLKSENPMDESVNNDSKVILKTEPPTTTGKDKTNIPADTSGSRVNKKRRKRRPRMTMPKNFKMSPDENRKRTSNRKPVVKKGLNLKLENIPEEKEEITEIMMVHVDVENNVMQQSVSQNNNISLEKRGKGKAANKTQNRSTSSNKNLSLGQESVSKTPGGEQQNKSIECSSCTTPIATPMSTAMMDILCKDCLCNVKQSRASKTLLQTVLMDQADKSLLTSQKTVPKKKKSTIKKKNDCAETTTNNETKQEETAKNNETHFKNENSPITSKRAQSKRATRSSTRSCVTNNNDITYTSTVIRQKGGGRGKKSTEEPPVLQSKNESQKKDSVQSTKKGPTKKPVSKSRQKKGLVQTTEEEEQAKSMNESHNKQLAGKAKKEPKKRNQKKTKQVESKTDRGDKSVLKNTNISKLVEQSVEKSVAYVNENHIECANNEEDKENNVTLSFVNDDLITSNQIATKETRKPSTTQVLQPRVENCLQESQQNVAAATKEVFAVPTVPPVKRARKPRQKIWMPQKKKTRKQSEASNKSTTPKQKLTKNKKRGERSTPNASTPQLKVNKSKRNRRVSFADEKLRNKDKSKNTPTSSSNNGKNVERTPITAKRIRVSPRKDTSSIDPTMLFDNSNMQIPKPFNKPQPNQHLNVVVEKPPAPPASSTRKRSVRTNDTLADVTVSSVDLTRGVGETTASYLVRKKKKLLDTKNNRLATPEEDQLNSTRISNKHTLRRLAPDISVIPKGPVANSNRRVPEAIISFVEGMKKTRKW